MRLLACKGGGRGSAGGAEEASGLFFGGNGPPSFHATVEGRARSTTGEKEKEKAGR